MPFYQKNGKLPNKRHIQFRDKDKNLYWEELISREGFNDVYSNVYHLNPPTAIKKVGNIIPSFTQSNNKEHRHHHLKTRDLNLNGDAIESREKLFFNSDVMLSKAMISKNMDYFYRNGHYDECLFIHEGSGKLLTNFGNLELSPGDYAIIPRGVIWKIDVKDTLEILVIETSGPIKTPKRYKNSAGQLLEFAPFSERDIKVPKLASPINNGPVNVKVKLRQGIQSYEYKYSPFDIVGWDGYLFPWVFNVHDFMPITGKIHQPPPVHQFLEAPGLVICNFVPRLFDYHPEAVPAPYAHSNVDSDEILYYVSGDFMSRKSVELGSITFHPAGLPHGPQPGKIEASLNAKEADEVAVMIDTFKPLQMTKSADKIDDKGYSLSWIDK